METNYKSRMLFELLDLTAKIERLGQYIENTKNKPGTEREIEMGKLLNQQFDIMLSYKEILQRRILLEMGCE